jgi:hypothetical protein
MSQRPVRCNLAASLGRVDVARAGVVDLAELDDRRIDEALSRMLEIDGDARADHGLHLSDAPIGLSGVADAHAWNEPSRHRIFLL